MVVCRHKDKVEERIEKLVRASMRSGPPPSAPVLYLCDAPWREIEEGKSSRMVSGSGSASNLS